MPVTIYCPDCEARLSIRSAPADGKLLKCPVCSASFRYPRTEDAEPEVRKKTGSEKKTSLTRPMEPEPIRKKSSAISVSPPRRRKQEEEIQEKENFRGRGRSISSVEEENEDQAPVRPRKKKGKKRGSNTRLIVGLSIGGGALVLSLSIALIFLVVGSKSGEGSKPLTAENPPRIVLAVNPVEGDPAPVKAAQLQPLGNIPAGNNPPVQLAGNNPVANNPVGNNPAGTNPAGDKPPAQNPGVANPNPGGGLGKEVLDRVKQATLLIRVVNAEGQKGSGTGFLDAESGLVLTNAHVVGMLEQDKPPQSVEAVLHSGQGAAREKLIPARIVTCDKLSDLAVLRLGGADGPSQGLPPGLSVQPTKDLQETQKVFVFGFPFGESLGKNITVSESSVSSLRTDKEGLLSQVQLNGGMHPGNSGGPVVNSEGQVVGVAVAGIRGTQINFAIPSEQVQAILKGRVSTVRLDEATQRAGQVAVPIIIGTIDPLQRLQRLSVDWWVGPPGQRIPASATPPVAGDRKRVVLNYNAAQQQAQGEILLPAAPPPGQVLYVQPSYAASNAQPRWLEALFQEIEAPPDPKPLQVTLRYQRGQSQLDLKSKGVFQVRTPRGDKASILINIVSKLSEQIQPLPQVGQGANVTVGVNKFEVGLSVNGKPPDIDSRMQKIIADIKFLQLRQVLDNKGAVLSSKADLTRVPATSRSVLDDFSAQMQQSLEAVSVSFAMPQGGTLQPGQTWTATRRITVDTFLDRGTGISEVTYKYLGTRNQDGKTVAVIALSGKIRPVAAPGSAQNSVTGEVRGRVSVDIQTGRVVRGNAIFDAALESRSPSGSSFRSSGTLTVEMGRGTGTEASRG